MEADAYATESGWNSLERLLSTPATCFAPKFGHELLDGVFGDAGIPAGDVVELLGVAGVGKTTACLQLAANVLLSHDAARVLYISSKAYQLLPALQDILEAGVVEKWPMLARDDRLLAVKLRSCLSRLEYAQLFDCFALQQGLIAVDAAWHDEDAAATIRGSGGPPPPRIGVRAASTTGSTSACAGGSGSVSSRSSGSSDRMLGSSITAPASDVTRAHRSASGVAAAGMVSGSGGGRSAGAAAGDRALVPTAGGAWSRPQLIIIDSMMSMLTPLLGGGAGGLLGQAMMVECGRLVLNLARKHSVAVVLTNGVMQMGSAPTGAAAGGATFRAPLPGADDWGSGAIKAAGGVRWRSLPIRRVLLKPMSRSGSHTSSSASSIAAEPLAVMTKRSRERALKDPLSVEVVADTV